MTPAALMLSIWAALPPRGGIASDEWGSGPKTVEVEGPAGKTVEVSCGGAAILDHKVHPGRRYVLLQCYGGTKLELFQRLIDLRSGRSLRLSFGSFSPGGSYGVFKRWPMSMWHPLQLVTLQQLHVYMKSGGRAGAIVVGKPPSSSCPFAVELDRWISDDILRYSLAACGTDDLVDYCIAGRRTVLVARSLDGSDMGRARRRHQPPLPSPCRQEGNAGSK
jgi:hypothetical protein